MSVRQVRGRFVRLLLCMLARDRAKGERKKRVAESDSGPNLLRHPAATVAETADVGALNLEELLHLDHSL